MSALLPMHIFPHSVGFMFRSYFAKIRFDKTFFKGHTLTQDKGRNVKPANTMFNININQEVVLRYVPNKENMFPINYMCLEIVYTM
jgi:hypothetical protein